MSNQTFTPPFRLGRKQKRAVLDSKGKELVLFPVGLEDYAKEYVEYLNKKTIEKPTSPEGISNNLFIWVMIAMFLIGLLAAYLQL